MLLQKEKKVKRFREYDLKGYRAAQGRNRIHDYPAMLHSLVVEKLLNEYYSPGNIVFDPFCGSGTTVVESLKVGAKVHGTDINPLALLIAKVRVTDIEKSKLDKNLKKIKKCFSSLTPEVPENTTNLEYWFKPRAIEGLGKLRTFTKQIKDEDLRDFTLVCLSKVARYVSNNRNGEFKRYRLGEKKLNQFIPKVYSSFVSTYNEYSYILLNKNLKSNQYKLHLTDTRNKLPFCDKVNLVITSPPYGDSRTTVAYGQYSSFGLDWIRELNRFGDENLKLDKKCLGGKKNVINRTYSSYELSNTLVKIKSKGQKRADEVESFFIDLGQSLKSTFNQVTKGGYLCYVVGNRTVKGINIPMNKIVKEQFTNLGATHVETRIRNISSKRMPSKNSPTNQVGKKSPTMSQEYILIFRK